MKGRRQRRSWTSGGRTFIEVADARVAEPLQRVPGVRGVVVDTSSRRAVVEFDPASTDEASLVRVVDETERAIEVRLPRVEDRHPTNGAPLARETFALAANGAAFGLAVAGRLARLARLPIELASVASVVQNQPRLRTLLEETVGIGPVALGLAAGNAIGNALGQGALGLVADLTMRGFLVREHRARARTWEQLEAEVLRLDAPPPDTTVDPGPRPVALPKGPVEEYADRAAAAGIAGLGTATLATASLRRGMATLLATTPKAAVQGREVFAAHLGRRLAERGVLCIDDLALRRLDRVDCLVVDAAALASTPTVTQVVPLGERDPAELHRVARDLLGTRSMRRHPWVLRLLPPRSPTRRRLDVRRALHQVDGADPLLLTRDGEPAALVLTGRTVDPVAGALVGAARRGGWMIAVAGDDTMVQALGGDLRVDGGEDLAASVRMLQADGCVVALVAGSAAVALGAADVGVGVAGESVVPWGAAVVCPTLADAASVVEAATVAHEVSRQSVAIALAGSGIAALFGLTLPAPGAAARVMATVNLAALVAQANGIRAATAASASPVVVRSEPPPWHEMTVDEVLARIGDGYGEAAVHAGDEAGVSLPAAVAEELVNPLTPVLAGAAVLSSAAGSTADALIVGAVTGANGLLGGVQRWRVANAIRALEARNGQRVRVLRPDGPAMVSSDEIVAGDLVELEAGDAVPADLRIVDADGLEVDESSLTGESVPVAKRSEPTPNRLVAERSSMLYDGTTIAAGTVTGVVVATGPGTEAGGAAADAGTAAPSGGVEARLAELTQRAIPVSVVGGALVTGAGLLRARPLRHSLHAGVSLAVAAVPEGLPLLATSAQIAAARRLARHGALVRNPRAVEALGRMDVLCADKTGTLTEGRITLRRVADGRRDVGLHELDEHDRYTLAVALRASPEERPDDALPHLTDQAVVAGAAAAAVTAANGGHPWERVAELPFEPARGYHAVLGRNRAGHLLSVKGAPEIVVPRCDRWRVGDEDLILDASAAATFGDSIDRLARRGFRVLAVAERRAAGTRDLGDERVARLTLLGYVALSDPVRASAAEAVDHLRRAGVRTVMVTGDHPSTAEGIAAELGLLDDGGLVLNGNELDGLSDDELLDALDGVSVFARVTPSQKLRLIRAYQDRGHVVGMTGDGANDAPAIRLADCGIALGEHSTSAARRSADVVVPDGRIETLHDAVIEGRAMWASVREAVAILLGGNLGETVFTVVGAAATGRSPLTPRQLLLVNLLTDALPAMAIATRAPADRTPERLVSEGPTTSLAGALERAILVRAFATAMAAGSAWGAGRLTGRRRRASTVALAALVGAQLGQTLTAGGRDPLVLAAALASSAALVGVIQVPGVSHLFGCTPLGPIGWGIVASTSAMAVVGASVASRGVARP